MIQSVDSIPGSDIIHSPPLNNDLLSFIGSSSNTPIESSLFQPPPDDNSPRTASDSALQFRPQFMPPTLEPSATTETTNSSEEAPDVQALLGAGSNFNVSNFLDGILGDPVQQQPPPQPVISEVTQEPTTRASSESTIPFQANTIGVSLDPWNSSENTLSTNNPLAALQGAVGQQESPIIAGIPLNSSNAPSLLSASNNTANTEYAEPAFARHISDEGEDEGDLLEPDSFYSQLLGED